MKKDDALALGDRLAEAARQAAEKAGYAGLSADLKRVHDEVDGVGRWALRLALPSWPHQPKAPGLRLEAWLFQGKPKPDEEALLLVVDAGLDDALRRKVLEPAFKELVEGGKFARRYKPLEPLVLRFYPHAAGAMRRAPAAVPAKLEAAWVQLVTDALKPLAAALDAWDPDGLKRAARGEAGPADPMEALRKKFGG